MSKIEKKEWLTWVFEWISGGLKELMDKITWWINEILIKLWLKKEKEIKEETENSKEEQIKLQIWIKIENNQEYKDFISWLEDIYDNEEIFKKIKENVEYEIFQKTDQIKDIDDNISETTEELSKNIEKIKQDDTLKDIIWDIYDDDDIEKKYSINQIIKAYEKTKKSKDNWVKIILNKDSVMVELKNQK